MNINKNLLEIVKNESIKLNGIENMPKFKYKKEDKEKINYIINTLFTLHDYLLSKDKHIYPREIRNVYNYDLTVFNNFYYLIPTHHFSKTISRVKQINSKTIKVLLFLNNKVYITNGKTKREMDLIDNESYVAVRRDFKYLGEMLELNNILVDLKKHYCNMVDIGELVNRTDLLITRIFENKTIKPKIAYTINHDKIYDNINFTMLAKNILSNIEKVVTVEMKGKTLYFKAYRSGGEPDYRDIGIDVSVDKEVITTYFKTQNKPVRLVYFDAFTIVPIDIGLNKVVSNLTNILLKLYKNIDKCYDKIASNYKVSGLIKISINNIKIFNWDV